MTLGDAVRELLQCLGTDGDSTIPWEQVHRWPKSTIDTFWVASRINWTHIWLQSECNRRCP